MLVIDEGRDMHVSQEIGLRVLLLHLALVLDGRYLLTSSIRSDEGLSDQL